MIGIYIFIYIYIMCSGILPSRNQSRQDSNITTWKVVFKRNSLDCVYYLSLGSCCFLTPRTADRFISAYEEQTQKKSPLDSEFAFTIIFG